MGRVAVHSAEKSTEKEIEETVSTCENYLFFKETGQT